MITEFANDVDPYRLQPRHQPQYKVLLYSRWLDTDTAIVTGVAKQQPIDLTSCVVSASLNLTADSDTSSLGLAVSLEDGRTGKFITPDLFGNCFVQLFEGYSGLPEESWVPTFSGIHVGQPRATEANTQDSRTASTSVGKRGVARRVDLTFTSRGSAYRNRRITTPGVWIPNGTTKNPDQTNFAIRDTYDDIGSIAHEIATNQWGMGLTGAEVSIGKLPYRIEKQLQVVDTNVFETLTNILQPLHLKPIFDGRGRLKTYAEDSTKLPVRTYPTGQVVELAQAASSEKPTNSVKMVGLSSELGEVVYADQRLLDVKGTFGYFDSELKFTGTWGADDKESFRVKLGAVTDGRGAVVASPRIVDFSQEGFIIEPVQPPTFTELSEFKYEIVVGNDVFLVVAGIAALLASYTALAILTTTLPEQDGDTPNPVAVAAEISSAGLMIAGLTVLQQIGNFSFEVWGVPFETVYNEIPAEHAVSNFAAFDSITGFGVRDYERVEVAFENHILSSLTDATTDDGTVNVGVQTWVLDQLSFEVAKSARRQVTHVVDILLEPGDVIQVDNQVIFVQSIQRTLERGATTIQTMSGHQLRKA